MPGADFWDDRHGISLFIKHVATPFIYKAAKCTVCGVVICAYILHMCILSCQTGSLPRSSSCVCVQMARVMCTF